MRIYNDISFIEVEPDESSQLTQKIMADDVIKLVFECFEMPVLAIGNFMLWNNTRYELNNILEIDKLSSRRFKVTAEFEGPLYNLNRASFLDGVMSATFDLTCKAETALTLLVNNLNRVFAGYTEGVCDVTEVKTVSFDKDNCLSALHKITEAFGIEFYMNDKTINFTAFGADTGLSFEYGQHKGLYEITRKNVQDSKVVTRLWAFGSDKNIYNYRDGKARLIFANPVLNNENRVEANLETFGVRETVQVFEDIYPHRTGSVTGVDTDDNIFFDNTVDFNINDYKTDETPKVNFITGNLSGITFDIGYDHSTKKFTLKDYTDAGVIYPNAAMKPAIGDQYIIIDIKMPQSYIDAAEYELKTKAEEWIAANSQAQTNYSIQLSQLYCKRNEISLSVGDYVTVSDSDFNITGLTRIVSLSQNIRDPFQLEIEVGNIQPKPFLIGLSNKVTAIAKSGGNTDLTGYAKKSGTLSGYGIADAYTKPEVDGLLSDIPNHIEGGRADEIYLQNDEINGGNANGE